MAKINELHDIICEMKERLDFSDRIIDLLKDNVNNDLEVTVHKYLEHGHDCIDINTETLDDFLKCANILSEFINGKSHTLNIQSFQIFQNEDYFDDEKSPSHFGFRIYFKSSTRGFCLASFCEDLKKVDSVTDF